MNLWMRVFQVLIGSLFRPRLGFTGESVLGFRVMPTDLDLNLHMNNSRYLAHMDLGRLDIILRTGLWRLVRSKRLQPVLAGCLVRFRRPLAPFQHFLLRSRLLGWDERWFYIQHLIEADGTLACYALMRAGFVRRGRLMTPARMAQAVGYEGPALQPPAWVERWAECEAEFARHPSMTMVTEGETCAR